MYKDAPLFLNEQDVQAKHQVQVLPAEADAGL